MSSLSKNFACNLQIMRKKSKMTQRELAERIDYSEKTIAKWESGTTLPSVEAIVKIATVFNADICDILKGKKEIYFLGIDAGGTKSRFRLCDNEGNVVKEIVESACNSFDMGMDEAQKVLTDGIRKVCWNVQYSSVVMYAGIAGGGVAEAKNKYADFFEKFGFAAYDNGSDNESIISAGLDGKDGITLIMGTGVCLHKCIGSVHAKIAGWGYFFDDGGSAFNFGQDALKAYFSELSGYGEKTSLSHAIEEMAGCAGDELLTKSYDGGKKYIASFAPLVFEHAEKHNDGVAMKIIDRNFKFIAKLITTATKDFTHISKVPVIISGGLTNQPRIMEYIYKFIENPDKIDLKILVKAPVDGAVKKAQQLWKLQRGKTEC